MLKDVCPQEKFCICEGFPVHIFKFKSKRPESYAPHTHNAMEFHFFRTGNGQYFINDANYPVGANTLLIVHENEVHSYTPAPVPSAVTETSLVISSSLLDDRPVSCAAQQRLSQVHLLVLSSNQALVVDFLLNHIIEEAERKGFNWRESIFNQIETLLIILQRAADGQGEKHVNRDPIIQDIMKYLDDEFMASPSLAKVSNHFGMSSCSLSRKFKDHVGVGFKEYLIHRCIVEATKLLEETDMKVTTIAYEVGFDNASTFSRDFRMRTGMTPANYRLHARAK